MLQRSIEVPWGVPYKFLLTSFEYLVLAPAAGFLCDMKGRAFSLSELSAERLELCAARLAASAEKVDRSVIRHLPQLKEGLVRCQIRIDDPLCDQVGTFDDLWRRQYAHPAALYVKLDQQSARPPSDLRKMDRQGCARSPHDPPHQGTRPEARHVLAKPFTQLFMSALTGA